VPRDEDEDDRRWRATHLMEPLLTPTPNISLPFDDNISLPFDDNISLDNNISLNNTKP
jgi:hypothetical protein